MKTQKAQMAQSDHDRLDRAIDHVAARLTHVEEDDLFAHRIVGALPDRRPVLWILQGWAPRLAVVALASLALTRTVVLQRSDDSSTKVLRSENATAVFAPYPVAIMARTSVERGMNLRRRTPVEPSSNDRLNRLDHEFSLAPIGEPVMLAMSDLTPSAIPASEPLSLAPLEIPVLVSGESFSPR